MQSPDVLWSASCQSCVIKRRLDWSRSRGLGRGGVVFVVGNLDGHSVCSSFLLSRLRVVPFPAMESEQPELPGDDVQQPELPGEGVWNMLSGWMEELGATRCQELFCGLATDNAYRDWLLKQLDIEDSEEIALALAAGAAAGQATVNATNLPADLSRAVGHRAVMMGGLRQKMKDLILAQVWREWDVAEMCRITDNDNPDGKLIYVKFHHRAAALHAILALYRERGESLPSWLQRMAQGISVKYLGLVQKEDAFARGLAASASMQEGAVRLNWVEIVLQVLAHGDSFGTALQAKVFAVCPEYAKKMNHWQHMAALTTRVSKRCYNRLENFTNELGLIVAPLPQTWLRESWILLKPRGAVGAAALTEDEQYFSLERLLGAVRVAIAQNPAPMTHNQLGRLIPEAQRKEFVMLAKKFIAGMSATGVSAEELLPRFARGEFDHKIKATSDPATAGRFWPWVKDR